MKLAKLSTVIALGIFLASGVRAQEAKPAEAAAPSGPVSNPVSSTVKQQLARFSKIMVAAAEAMPAEKYNFKPTPEMSTFGHLTIHISQGNTMLCSRVSGMTAPDAAKLADTDPKDKLVAGMKASFDFCATALANVDDSKLSDPMVLFGNRPSSRAGAMIALNGSWSDHYSQEAMYLRLSGILPPTAQATH